jgi:hypothetical protein
MKKTLIIILIIMLCYLAFIAIFTNRKTICEPLINIGLSENQYISWINSNNDEFAPIKYTHMLANANANTDWTLVKNIFQALNSQNYKDLLNLEEINEALISASGDNPVPYQFKKEPLFLIKAPQAILITHNKTVTAIPITSNSGNVVLKARESVFNPVEKKLDNDTPLSNKIINLDKILVLDSENIEKPAVYTDYKHCYLIKVYEHKIDQEVIPIYILAYDKDNKFSGDKDLRVSIY